MAGSGQSAGVCPARHWRPLLLLLPCSLCSATPLAAPSRRHQLTLLVAPPPSSQPSGRPSASPEPTKEMLAMSGWSRMRLTVSCVPCTTLSTPLGRPVRGAGAQRSSYMYCRWQGHRQRAHPPRPAPPTQPPADAMHAPRPTPAAAPTRFQRQLRQDHGGARVALRGFEYHGVASGGGQREEPERDHGCSGAGGG